MFFYLQKCSVNWKTLLTDSGPLELIEAKGIILYKTNSGTFWLQIQNYHNLSGGCRRICIAPGKGSLHHVFNDTYHVKRKESKTNVSKSTTIEIPLFPKQIDWSHCIDRDKVTLLQI